MRANFLLSLVVIAGAFTLNDATLAESAPDTPKKPVTTEYHGVTVEDPYQWLESDEDSQVKAWSDAQNQQTRKNLDSFPDRTAIEKQLQGVVRENFAELFLTRLAARNFVCDEVPATETTAAVGDARVSGRSEVGKNSARSERPRHERHDSDGLVCAVVGRQICRHVTFQGWQRRWHTSFLRNRNGQSAAGHDCACPISHGRRQRGLERGFHRGFLHTVSQERRAAGC